MKRIAVVLLCATSALSLSAQTLTTLHSFDGADGSAPNAALVQATNGDFYGTTNSGGTSDYGTVFKIAPSGALTTLYSFCSQSGCADGEGPVAGLVQATNGNLYGTTYHGGTCGGGTVFKITPGGTFTTLDTFVDTDGEFPSAGLLQAGKGDLYGTTVQGGVNGQGAAFKITPAGALTEVL
jgi:uncharacterized repeat protein (TIGR03803 family)